MSDFVERPLVERSSRREGRASMKASRLILGIGLGVLVCVTSAGAALTVQSACSGNGIIGSYSENSATVTFESCIVSGAVHSKVSDSTGTIAELWSNMDGTNLTYEIAGEAVTGNATSQQWSSWQAFLGSSAPWHVATHLVGAMKAVGFDPLSNGLIGLSALIGPYEGGGYVVLNTGPGCSSSECGSKAHDCRGCCGDGCDHCLGVCTDECAAHDDCVRNNEPMCGDKFFAAAVSIVRCLGSGHLICCAT